MMDAPRLTVENGDYKLAHDEPLIERLQEVVSGRNDVIIYFTKEGKFRALVETNGAEADKLEDALRAALGAYYA